MSLKKYTFGRISFAVSVLLIALFLIFFVVASLVSSAGYTQKVNAQNSERIKGVFGLEERRRFTIIIDAGHGGEDPGAVVGQIEEKTLNLSISNKLYAFASLFDVDILMTRRDDRMLYDEGQETRKKSHDLYNRLKFTEKYTDSMFISIHQNKFPLENCRGLQVFYALKNENSKVLAEHVQNAALLLQPDNHRVVKPGTNIYLLENSTVPSVIVECGFISNPEEAQQLCDDNYTDKLAFAIYCGIAAYLEDVKIEG